MAYEGRCGSCCNFEEMNSQELYDKTNASYIKGFCTWYGVCYYPDDSCQSHYQERESSSNGCYITTIVCNRLGLPDTCMELEILRSFRAEVLQRDKQYAPILYEYDTVGPQISRHLETEDLSVVQGLFLHFIQPITRLLKENQQEEAIHRYQCMTNSLKEFYALTSDEVIEMDYNYRTGGHGSKKIETPKVIIKKGA